MLLQEPRLRLRLFGGALVLMLGLCLAAHPAGAVESDAALAATPNAGQKVAVLDAGSAIRVEAENATVGEVLEALRTQLNITFFNMDRIDQSRVVSGSRFGSVNDVMAWLVPNGGFVIIYKEQERGESKPLRAERIGFLEGGNPTPGLPNAPAPIAARPVEANGKSVSGANRVTAVAPSAKRLFRRPSKADQEAGKPDVPDSGRSEIRSVAEQLRGATPLAQLDTERQANDPNRPLPDFLRSYGDAAQTTLQQQQQRTQALAAEQLRGLIGALGAACRGTAGSPC
jgi:hypothetical protein